MKIQGSAIGILVDKNNKTIGARLNINGKIKDLSTDTLAEQCNSIELNNAVIDSKGFIRAKRGNLPRIQRKEKPNTIENREIQQVKKLLSKNPMILYHGNKDANMIPAYGKGSSNNDYGIGFYTTPDAELGKEWAMAAYTYGGTGYLHKYELDIAGLNILDLTELDSLHWVAELLANRSMNFDDKEALYDTIQLFLAKYKLKTDTYDIIIGYRADDSYFTYAEDFVSGAIYKETLENALRYGDLGIQVFIKSKRAFERLHAIGKPEIVPAKYKQIYDKRRKSADEKYRAQKVNRGYIRKKETIHDFI